MPHLIGFALESNDAARKLQTVFSPSANMSPFPYMLRNPSCQQISMAQSDGRIPSDAVDAMHTQFDGPVYAKMADQAVWFAPSPPVVQVNRLLTVSWILSRLTRIVMVAGNVAYLIIPMEL